MKNAAFRLMKKAGKGFVRVKENEYGGAEITWSDGCILILNENYDSLPEYVRTENGEWELNASNTDFIKGKCPDMKAVIPDNNKQQNGYQEATPVRNQLGLLTYRIGDWHPIFCMVLETQGGIRKAINLRYFDHLEGNWCNGKWYVTEDDTLPVMYKLDEELKGLVMVIRWDKD